MSKGMPWREWGHGDCLSGENEENHAVLPLPLTYSSTGAQILLLRMTSLRYLLVVPLNAYAARGLMLVQKLLHTCPFKDALRSSERPPCPASQRWARATGTAGRTEQMWSTCVERHIREELWIRQGEFSNPTNTACTSKWGHVEGRLNKSCRQRQVLRLALVRNPWRHSESRETATSLFKQNWNCH